MPEPSSSNVPGRRVGVYERLRGPAGGSPRADDRDWGGAPHLPDCDHSCPY
jgi:hypothetical protein